MSLLDKDEEILTARKYMVGSGKLRVVPEKWLPLLLDAYKELLKILEPLGIRPIIIGTTVYDQTKSLDIALSNPLPVDGFASVLSTLIQILKDHGYKVLSGLIEQGRSSVDWIMRIPVVMRVGEIVELRIINMLNSGSDFEIATLPREYCRSETTSIDNIVTRLRCGLKEWEKPLEAAAMYFVDPRPEEEVLRDMEKLVGSRENVERIAALVWRIAFGEGYTDEEWFKLLESLKILRPWECIWRFQELAEKGLRKKRNAESANLSDREILRAACKALGTG